MTRRPPLLYLAAFAVALAACKGDSNDGDGGGDSGPVTRPAGSVAVSFTVDDTINQVYSDGDLAWTGTFKYFESTRVLQLDASANGPYPFLRDDGPWTEGGHEPEGEVAGDHRHGVTVFIAPPDAVSATLDFEYRLADATYAALPPEGFGTGDVWPGANGEFSVSGVGTALDLTLPDFAFGAFGTTDVRLVLDLAALAPGTWDTSRIFVRSALFPWTDVRLSDEGLLGDDAAGDGKLTFVLSEMVGPGNPFDHTGLPVSGTAVDFHFRLGEAPYRDGGGAALTAGVTAFTKAAGGAFEAATVTVEGGELRVVVP